VRAAAVNPSDWKIREGYLGRNRPLPAVLGRSVSGIVELIGEGVAAFQVGDEIFGATTSAGAYVEQTIVAERVAAPKPASVSFADASTLPISAATGYDGISISD
jgi:NADPH:quinone reductase-like Zn-dependent oxidoreductase